MTKVTVLGLGAMGSRMAANLLKAGHAVTVWNRSPAKTLVTAGAQLAASPKAAAQGADFVIAMVRDDDASRDLWLSPETGAFAGLSQGAVAIESSTLTANWARTLGEEAKQRGLTFLEAPVAGSRPQAEAAQLVYFVGGDSRSRTDKMDQTARSHRRIDRVGLSSRYVRCCCLGQRSMEASRTRRSALSRWRSIRRMPFPYLRGPQSGSSLCGS
jgi:3-hydroxyisobutyrate dehydrogenase-like beta-hydroxyacid dehydrogenase